MLFSYKMNHLGVSFLSFFKRFSPENNFYLFADPRGGSTWLAEMLVEIPKTEMLWEPLHTYYDSELRKVGFSYRQSLPIGHNWDQASQIMEKIISGNKWNVYSARKINLRKYITAEHLLVKFCRGNRMLPWLCDTYNFNFKPVYLVRHPFAVVLSQLKQGSWTNEIVDKPISTLNPLSEQKEYESYVQTLRTKEEKLVATWCISNKEVLELCNESNKWITITYEDLLLNTTDTLDKIFKTWSLQLPTEVDSEKPSSTAIESLGSNPENQLSKWKNELSAESIRKMLRVIEYFDIKLYNDSILPDNSSL